MVSRDNTIDFLRGIAVLSIIFIHTCFSSGYEYVPEWLRSISLMIDVPLFIFISGMTFNFNKNKDIFKSLKRIIKLWNKWLVFLILYFLIMLFLDYKSINLKEILSSLFFHFTPGNHLPTVNGSLWFIFMFFVVMIISDIIIYLYHRKFKNLNNFKYILIILFLFYGMDLYTSDFLVFSTPIIMYTFIYCLGYYLYNFEFTYFKKFIGVLIGIVLTVIVLLCFNESHDYGFLDMQGSKWRGHINYFAYSCISFTLAMYIKDKLIIGYRNIIAFIGRNALLFYFCQGIGASLLFKIYPIFLNLHGKLIIMFLANLLITCICFIIMYFTIKQISKIKMPDFKIFKKK